MYLRTIAFFLLNFLFILDTKGQTLLGKVFINDTKPLAGVSVTLHKKNQSFILAFAITDKEGKFKINYTSSITDSLELSAVMLGFSKESVFFILGEQKEFSFILHPQTITLPEVKLKNQPVWQRKDSINYDVSAFKQQQDRVIGDVIARLPGIEVSPSGQIKYNGKPINKYYIEGLDLLEDKYGIANNNIPADVVDKVQVLENHQPIRVLDSVSFSERAALNIKLKSNAKLKLIGRVKLGIGASPLLSEDEIMGMLFKKKIQFINTYKFNNTSLDNTRELTSHNIFDIINGYQNGATKIDLLALIQPAPPPIASSRYLFNNAHVFSINQLIPLKKDVQLRFNTDYVNDYQRQQSSVQTKIFLPTDTILINEKAQYRGNTNMLQSNLALMANTSKYYLKNNLKFQGWWPGGNSYIDAALPISQILENPFSNIENNFKLIRTKGKAITEWSSYIGYSSLPQNLQISPGLYADLLNNNTVYDALFQTASLKNFYTDNHYSFRNKKSKILGQYKLGFIVQLKNLETDLQILQSGIKISVADTFQNHLHWQRYSVYSENEWSFQNQKLRLSFMLPVSYNQIHYNDSLLKVKEEKGRLFINPSISSIFTLSQKWNLNIGSSFNQSFGNIQSISKGYILKTYRNVGNNDAPLAETQNFHLSTSLTFRNPLKILFFNSGISYSRAKSNLLYSQQYNGRLETLTALLVDNYRYTTNLSARFSKYIMDWKTTVAASGAYSFGNAEQLQQQQKVKLTNKSWVFGATLNSKLSKKASAEYQNSFSRYFSKSQLQSVGNVFKTFNQNISFNYYPTNQVIIRVVAEHYNIKNTFANKANYIFSDIAFRYKPKKSKVDYELISQNLFNTTSFTTGVLSDNLQTISEFQIRPRQFLFKMIFSF